jgi:hypothetical protein
MFIDEKYEPVTPFQLAMIVAVPTSPAAYEVRSNVRLTTNPVDTFCAETLPHARPANAAAITTVLIFFSFDVQSMGPVRSRLAGHRQYE